MKVLIVDDNHIERLILKDFLLAEGHSVLEAQNGKEAYQTAIASIPDMIISDILMPVMDGFKFCEAVRSDNILRKIAFVFYTATYTDDRDEALGLRIGADRFFRKPMNWDTFNDVLLSIFREKEKKEKDRVLEKLQPAEDINVSLLYDERLVTKLENKVLELEKTQQDLEINIEQRKHMEEELRKAEIEKNLILDSTSEVFVYFNTDMQVRWANRAAQDLYGLAPEDLSGRSCREICVIKDKLCATCPIQKGLEADNFQEHELATSNNRFWLLRGYPVIDADKNKIGILSLWHDITDRKKSEETRNRLENQLRHSQKMEAIGTLASGISHDFNNILSAIIGFSELAVANIEKGTELYSDIHEVLRAGHRARELVKRILTFSRQKEEEKKPVQMVAIVNEAIKFLRASLPANIEIRQLIDKNLSNIWADASQMHQVAMNLCTNAAYSMREKSGVLELCLSEVALDSSFTSRYTGLNPGNYLKMTVRDTGHGMSPEVLERIYEPYYTTKKMNQGTGLGLSVVHGIIQSHGGMISVQSEIGKGTSFEVYIPCIHAKVITETIGSQPVPTGNERILVVDDEKPITVMLKQMLERLGYRVEIRTNSIEALELFRSRHDMFDLVITDMTMPQMLGEELAAELIRIRPDIPIILCTGFSEKIQDENARNIGVRAVVMKPILRKEMAPLIREILDK